MKLRRDQAFLVVALKPWNELPLHVHCIALWSTLFFFFFKCALDTFKSSFKTFFFEKLYSNVCLRLAPGYAAVGSDWSGNSYNALSFGSTINAQYHIDILSPVCFPFWRVHMNCSWTDVLLDIFFCYYYLLQLCFSIINIL